MPEKKKVLGLSRPVFALVIVSLLVLLAVGFLVDVGEPRPELSPEEVFSIGGFTVTNTVLTAWITTLVLVGVFWAATRRIKLVPGRLQMACELVLGWVYNMCKDAVGEKNGRRFFPLVVTIFLFVIVNALMNLIPGYGAILITNSHGETVPLLRGANTDINVPLMLALVSFVMVEYWGIWALGRNYPKKFFNFGPLFTSLKKIFVGKIGQGFGGMFNAVIAVFVGLLEFVLEFFRILSFTFRLFGNMTGGEILLLTFIFISPFVMPLLPYTLEFLVAFIQALIFAGLTLSFAAVAVTPHSEEAH